MLGSHKVEAKCVLLQEKLRSSVVRPIVISLNGVDLCSITTRSEVSIAQGITIASDQGEYLEV